MNLSEMTREQLWEIHFDDICLLMKSHFNFSNEETFDFGRNNCLIELDKIRLELQKER